MVDTAFFGDGDKEDYPRNVYITLKKKGQLAYSGHAEYVEAAKKHQITVDLQKLMQE